MSACGPSGICCLVAGENKIWLGGAEGDGRRAGEGGEVNCTAARTERGAEEEFLPRRGESHLDALKCLWGLGRALRLVWWCLGRCGDAQASSNSPRGEHALQHLLPKVELEIVGRFAHAEVLRHKEVSRLQGRGLGRRQGSRGRNQRNEGQQERRTKQFKAEGNGGNGERKLGRAERGRKETGERRKRQEKGGAEGVTRGGVGRVSEKEQGEERGADLGVYFCKETLRRVEVQLQAAGFRVYREPLGDADRLRHKRRGERNALRSATRRPSKRKRARN